MPDVSRKRAAIGQLRDNKRYGVSRSSQLAASVNQEAAVEEEVDDEEYEREMEKERRFIVDGDYVDSDFAESEDDTTPAPSKSKRIRVQTQRTPTPRNTPPKKLEKRCQLLSDSNCFF